MVKWVRVTWRSRVSVFAWVGMCVCACVISGLSILFRIFAKPTYHTLLIYPIFCVKFCHVGLFVFLFMCR